MIQDLAAFWVIRHITEQGSISATARKLGLSNNSVGGELKRLEERLGVMLFERKGRSFKITEAGKRYMAQFAPLHAQLREARAIVMNKPAEQKSADSLRVEAPSLFLNRYLAPRLATFLTTQKGLSLELSSQEAPDGIPGKNLLQLSVSKAPPLGARVIAELPWVIVGSPSYLATFGALVVPDDIAQHRCLKLSSRPIWSLQGPRPQEIQPRGSIISDHEEALAAAALGGLGLALLPRYLVERELMLGALVRVLPGFTESQTLFAALPQEGELTGASAKLLTFLTESLRLHQG